MQYFSKDRYKKVVRVSEYVINIYFCIHFSLPREIIRLEDDTINFSSKRLLKTVWNK